MERKYQSGKDQANPLRHNCRSVCVLTSQLFAVFQFLFYRMLIWCVCCAFAYFDLSMAEENYQRLRAFF